MHWPEITTLRRFYASRLGGITQHYVERALLPTAEKLKSHNILGLGYAIPHLAPFFGNKNQVVAVTPSHEGGVHWPYHAACLSAIAEELELPFADGSIDMVLLAHTLEYSEQPVQLLQEIWRVLSPSGQLLVLVPNRQGVWAHVDSTPFGSGRPYSGAQLRDLFEQACFMPMHSQTLLFSPPSNAFVTRPHRVLEAFGNWALPAFGGLLLGCAKKQVYALSKEAKKRYTKKKMFVPAMGSSMNRAK